MLDGGTVCEREAMTAFWESTEDDLSRRLPSVRSTQGRGRRKQWIADSLGHSGGSREPGRILSLLDWLSSCYAHHTARANRSMRHLALLERQHLTRYMVETTQTSFKFLVPSF